MKSLCQHCACSEIFLVALMCLLGACGKPPVAEYPELTMAVALGDAPKSLAVLPFKNLTEIRDLEELVRSSFYSHLSVRPYRDVEIYIVDDRLRRHLFTTKGRFSDIPIKDLGRLLGCDAAIFGEVTEFQTVFAGIYSQMAIGAAISIWDTRSEQVIWRDQHVVRFHEGGIPLNPVDVPLISLRSGWNLRAIVKIRAVDELARYLARRIPAPQSDSFALTDEHSYTYELQVGAFLDKERAIRLIERLRSEGQPAFMQRNRDDRGLWHRVLVGPYEDAEEALRIQEAIQTKLGTGPFIVPVPSKTHSHEAFRR